MNSNTVFSRMSAGERKPLHPNESLINEIGTRINAVLARGEQRILILNENMENVPKCMKTNGIVRS